MRYKLLICDDANATVKAIKKGIPYQLGAVSCCKPDERYILPVVREGSFDAVLLFSNRRYDDFTRLIGRLRQEQPTLSIFVGMYSHSLGAAGDFFKAGAELCFELPTSAKRIGETIHCFMKVKELPEVPAYAACYLRAEGLSHRTDGFIYLSMAVDICLHDPTALESMYEMVYTVIAERLNVQVKSVERLLRNIADSASADGLVAKLTGGETDSANAHDLISALCDNYAHQHYYLLRQ